MTKESDTDADAPAESGQLTPAEKHVIDAFCARPRQRGAKIKLKTVYRGSGGRAEIVPAHRDELAGHILLMASVGTEEAAFLDGLLKQLSKVASKGEEVDESGLNFMLAVVQGIEPRDQLESMLAAQMAATHVALMKMAQNLMQANVTIPQQDAAERAFNKLARTFAAQMQTLKQHRSSGDQTMRVEHVTVNEGGQAIVGNVRHGGGGVPETKKSEATT